MSEETKLPDNVINFEEAKQQLLDGTFGVDDETSIPDEDEESFESKYVAGLMEHLGMSGFMMPGVPFEYDPMIANVEGRAPIHPINVHWSRDIIDEEDFKEQSIFEVEMIANEMILAKFDKISKEIFTSNQSYAILSAMSEKISASIYSAMQDLGYIMTEGNDLKKDMAFVSQTILSMLLRNHGHSHPLNIQDIVDIYFDKDGMLRAKQDIKKSTEDFEKE